MGNTAICIVGDGQFERFMPVQIAAGSTSFCGQRSKERAIEVLEEKHWWSSTTHERKNGVRRLLVAASAMGTQYARPRVDQ